ncbi:hypothetical protein [Jiella pacifica]|uniref:Lipoprotein n=1 Tax=Jiella pacifica TaxID=2696469 RepID=A0A6N9T4I3_9HYPH|nr:hypothetical protein [Jiella pacifica]NDW06294.1 hypothetical protein [Jiella pacifica]
MRTYDKAFLAVAAIVALSGCAIRPLPDPVTRTDTYGISLHIRCETYRALRKYAIGLIRIRNSEIAERLETGALEFKDLNLNTLDDETRGVIERYDQTTIAYSFRFEITEFNKIGGDIDILHTMTSGRFGLGAKASDDHERSNTRSFRVIDDWRSLLTVFNSRYCDTLSRPSGSNFAYPIAGDIGMEEQIRLFYDMNQSGNLVGSETNAPSISDTLIFTTKIGGSITPRLELIPLNKTTQLTKASITGELGRWDVHQVIVNISLPPEEKNREPTIAEQRAIRELNRQENLQLDNNLAREIARELR